MCVHVCVCAETGETSKGRLDEGERVDAQGTTFRRERRSRDALRMLCNFKMFCRNVTIALRERAAETQGLISRPFSPFRLT